MVDLREDKPLRVLAGLPYVDVGLAIHQFLLHRGLVGESLGSCDHRGLIVLLRVLVRLDPCYQSVSYDGLTVAVSSFPALSSIVDGLHHLLLLLNNTCWAIDHQLTVRRIVSEPATVDADAALIVATHDLRRCDGVAHAAAHVGGFLPTLNDGLLHRRVSYIGRTAIGLLLLSSHAFLNVVHVILAYEFIYSLLR